MSDYRDFATTYRNPEQQQTLYRGTVTALGTGYTISVQVDGETTATAGVRYGSHVYPKVGSTVLVQRIGGDLFAVASVAGKGGVVPTVRVTRSTTAQTIVSGTSTAISWDTSQFDSGHSMWTSGTNVVLPLPGMYQVQAGVAFAADNTGLYRLAALQINGSARGSARYTNNTGGFTAAQVPIIQLSNTISGGVGDTITVNAQTDQTTTVTVGGNVNTFLTVTYLGPAA